MSRVTLVATGIANIASVVTAFARTGADTHISESPDAVLRADRVVLPGVGAFGPGMDALRRHELVDVLRERVATGRPTLAVCLGLHLLCEASEESPGARGLAVIPGTARRFADTLRVPQMGWNRVRAAGSCRLLEHGWAYFANSYHLAEAPAGWHPALADYGGPFVAAMERGHVLACQFHPELSGPWGVELLRRWLRGGAQC